ncbi:MAG: uroporphyrinogen decarboxylase family protein [Eubacteriales bacterium]|nr:uroporphyrinogen decarboxylase family protein [Eubacteriales bacterium]
MTTKDWLTGLLNAKQKPAIPVLSFPCVSLMDIMVNDLIHSSELQAEGMARVAARVPSGASVSMMDLSVEAEAFGSAIRFDEKEVPAVTNILVHNEEEARARAVPPVGAGRTGLYVEAIRQASKKITDRPVFAGIIGPFSLAGRLVGVSEAMLYCYDEPEMMQIVLEKAAEFLTNYALAYKQTGAAGIVMAEPLAGLLSPAQAKTFSHPYVKQMIDAVQDENFLVIYHNCGESTAKMVEDLVSFGASAYHFGNKVDMADILSKMPNTVIAMGNVDPAGQFKNGTPQSISDETKRILERCARYPNFVISSGCDIPPASPWENIDAFFAAVSEFNRK